MAVLIGFHATCATIALLLGAAVLLRRVKGDRLHRLAGRTWVATMYVALFTSLPIQRLHPGHFSIFHALTLFTLTTVTLGLRSALRGKVAAHRGRMIGSYLGLLGAFIGAVAVPHRDVPQLAVHDPAAFAAAALGCIAATVVILALLGRLAGRHPDRAVEADHLAVEHRVGDDVRDERGVLAGVAEPGGVRHLSAE